MCNNPAPRLFFASLLLALLLAANPAAPAAYAQSLDRVLAVVDENIITEYEVQQQLDYYKQNGQKDPDGSLRCMVFENMLIAKLLLAKAKADSLEVMESQVEAELDRRISNMIRQVGELAELERVIGQSVLELREELRPDIREQLMVEQQRSAITANAEVTPREVKRYFKSIPTDSIPYLPAEVRLSHIVIQPEASQENKDEARQKLLDLHGRIKKGDITFEDAARIYSQDLGSAKQGGDLGEFGRGEMVPEFEEVAYNLTEGQVSSVFESPYGFHIMRLEKRLGERVRARHILIRPLVDAEDKQRAKEHLEEVRQIILSDSMTFAAAAARYSDDRQTKDNGGAITTRAGERRIPLNDLDADLYLQIDQMEEGQISEPTTFIDQTRGQLEEAWRIVKLHKRYPPHAASLEQDYEQFQKAALQAREAELLDEWLDNARKQVYIELRPSDCAQSLEAWYQAQQFSGEGGADLDP